METRNQKSWEQANKDYLMARLELICHALKRACGEEPGEKPVNKFPIMEHDIPAAIETLGTIFILSSFERDMLLLCAGIELDGEFASLCAKAQGNAQRNYPTFSLALSILPNSYWSALSPSAPLRYWGLIEVESGRSLTQSPLRIDERILHYLVGVSYLNKPLSGLFQLLEANGPMVPSHQKIAQEIAAICKLTVDSSAAELPVVQLNGTEFASHQNIAVAACSHFSNHIFLLSVMMLPANTNERENILRLWEREAILSNSALLLDCRGVDRSDTLREGIITQIIERNKGLLILSSGERHTSSRRALLTFNVQKPTSTEQRMIWQSALGDQASVLDREINKLVSHFQLNEATIHAVSVGAQGRLLASEQQSSASQTMGQILWDLCRTQMRPKLDDLAQWVEPMATWEDLVVPDQQRAILQEIAIHVQQKMQVYETWGFAGKTARGLGISALFVGASGVGKTMAAEVLTRELRLDLYRIDLSAVVSKYIGETEKNLRRVFDAAEESEAILLFDEADAIFGKRSEVKDSHDRYANIEISYLLQRMEAYRGLAILTTNMKDALDTAFMRRIRFIVQFPFPDAGQRAEIWRRVFPEAAPTEGLHIEKLAQLNIAGGNIRNIALHAAFIAADSGEPVQMKHVLRATRHEYAKLEKALTSTETRGWDQ